MLSIRLSLSFVLSLLALLPVNGASAQAKPQGKQPAAGAGKTAPVKYLRVDNGLYTIEVPEGWSVATPTPWGARDIKPGGPGGKGVTSTMTAMTAQIAEWDAFYKTALGYILRNYFAGQVQATPYVVGKSKQGLDTCSWSIVDQHGGLKERYIVLKSATGKALALSVKIPVAKEQKQMEILFRHLVDTAGLR